MAFLTIFSCLRPACLEAPNVSASSRKLSLTALIPGQSDYMSKTYIPIKPVWSSSLALSLAPLSVFLWSKFPLCPPDICPDVFSARLPLMTLFYLAPCNSTRYPVYCSLSVVFIQHPCIFVVVVAVQLLSFVQLFATPWTVACQASLSFTVSKFAQTHVHWVSDAI